MDLIFTNCPLPSYIYAVYISLVSEGVELFHDN